MTRRRFISILLVGLLAYASTVPVEARRDDRRDERRDDRSDRRSRREAEPQRHGISLDEAVSRVRRQTGGRVLSAEAHDNRGTLTYRIKVLMPNGAVRVYHVDAQSGRMN